MYLVVFRNRKRADLDAAAYAADAARMEALARAQPGFHSFKSYEAEDGEVIAVSEWSSAAAAHAWGSHPDHAVIQRRGRSDYYQTYTLFTCEEPGVHRFAKGDK